jgi:hypothetical protein
MKKFASLGCSIPLDTLSRPFIPLGQDAERLAGVLAQCPALSYLDVQGNQIGDQGGGSLVGVLPQCPALSGKKNEREIVHHSLSDTFPPGLRPRLFNSVVIKSSKFNWMKFASFSCLFS